MTAADAAARMSGLRTVLDGLVPLYMMTLPREGLEDRAARAADVIASTGDAFEGDRSRESGRSLLNALAEAIAVLALTDTGCVELFGGHWCIHGSCGGVSNE